MLVTAEQDKVRMSHYTPLHPAVVKAVEPILCGLKNTEKIFSYNATLMWMKREKIALTQIDGHFLLSDLRKFAEQYGDVIGWDNSNRAYILTHGVSGIDWKHYNYPLPENIYDKYMESWKSVQLENN